MLEQNVKNSQRLLMYANTSQSQKSNEERAQSESQVPIEEKRFLPQIRLCPISDCHVLIVLKEISIILVDSSKCLPNIVFSYLGMSLSRTRYAFARRDDVAKVSARAWLLR